MVEQEQQHASASQHLPTAASFAPPEQQPVPSSGMSTISSQPEDVAGVSSRASQLSSSTPRLYPTRSVRHPSTKRPSVVRTLSNSIGKVDAVPEPSTSSSPIAAPALSPSIVSQPRSLDDVLPEPTTHAKKGDGDDSIHPEAASASRGGTASVASLQYLTTRFEHTVGEDGTHLVLTGRNGELQRCEDETIHAPGAIQSFGCLIAFDQFDRHRLIVQQVSENSRLIIGYSPSTLFRLPSLTAIFDEDEVDILLEALDTLDERDSDPHETERGPITFTLSGQGQPGGTVDSRDGEGRLAWQAHCALHRPNRGKQPNRAVLELELVDDSINPLSTVSSEPIAEDERGGMSQRGDHGNDPTEEELLESTVSMIKPLRALARVRTKSAKRNGRAEVDVVSLLAQINEQLDRAQDLQTFLKTVAAIMKDLSEFDRCMIYQFDEAWNGRVVAELADWTATKDLFAGLNFPASDIPPQARELYKINKVRLLYDRDQPTARLCCRNAAEVDNPLDMTHAHLRAMSPIHLKYLSNMGVRSSMSISICAFGDLWGLIALHTYGRYGKRVSFPVRELCKLLGDSISRNIERLSYARRIHSRKLINTTPTAANPSGYIVANGDDLLSLFDADFGVLSIGEEAKILGPVSNSQELLVVLNFLRDRRFTTIEATQDIHADWKGIDYSSFELIAGVLSVPLSGEGKDFIAFFRRGQLQEVKWAGNPYAHKREGVNYNPLEPRQSFKVWSEMVVGRCRAWTDEQRETAGTLALVYGRFISVWREKEDALRQSRLKTLLLQNASHQVRTPLNHIIGYLQLAMEDDLSPEVRRNLANSHAASRSLVHVVNDLLELTQASAPGQDLFLQDPFDLPGTIEEAISMYRSEVEQRGLTLEVIENPSGTPSTLLGDRAKIKAIIANVVGNAVEYTKAGGIVVEWGEIADEDIEDAIDKKQDSIRIGIAIRDTGVGISEERLESIFREFEQVSAAEEASDGATTPTAAVGLGLAVVARVVRNLEGQLRVESSVEEGKSGSIFTFILPFRLPFQDSLRPRMGNPDDTRDGSGTGSSRPISVFGTSRGATTTTGATTLVRTSSRNSIGSGESSKGSIDSLITSLSTSVMGPQPQRPAAHGSARSYGSSGDGTRGTKSGASRFPMRRQNSAGVAGTVDVASSGVPIRAVKMPTPSSPQPSVAGAPPTESSGSFGSGSSGRKSRSPATMMEQRQADQPTSSSEFATIPEKQSPQHISEYKMVGDDAEDKISFMRVLVVEDELVNRMILQKRLVKDRHEVVIAVHGGDALRLLEKDFAFDVILMDLMMPIKDGFETTEAIRAMEAASPLPHAQLRPSTILNGRIPIIAVSASLPEKERPRLVESGFDGWSLKPVDFKRLRNLMRGAVDIARRKTDVYRPGFWEQGGWLEGAPTHRPPAPPQHDPASDTP
ncbi:hypothetical protein BCR35DRAFT_281817 [Leucosporidium creatinivorum]|uniref:GAF domain-like protein n=1 Tax=Leucosporidium creatinivorum TaxID=106004 RepID=A0A1Y2EP96_9BASI|nr:hypothetical protein BCR35DRAFT_281817 [Leucosporidium creatinivorum]